MTVMRPFAQSLAMTALAVAPTIVSAQTVNPGQVIRQGIGQEVRQFENGRSQSVQPAQGTVIQEGQPNPTTIVPVGAGTTTGAAPTIGSHQIDRFEAIRQLQTDLKSDGNNLANWTILGELAHEVAVDLPSGQDDTYYKISRDAYEHAAQLDPNNIGLKAAVQFAREQEANAANFDAQRRQAVATYLDARRREMAINGVNPTIQVYESPAPTTATFQGQPAYGGNQILANSAPTQAYRPYYNQQTQQPYGYSQYQNGYSTAGTNALNGNQAVAPTTLRQYGQQLPGVLINEGVRTFGRPGAVPR